MEIRARDLAGSLNGPLQPIYLVTGDEPLLVQEACDAILGTARAAGYTEREVLHADGGFDWNNILHSAGSMSLFAERRIVDLRVGNARVDKTASEVLRHYASAPPDDTLLLIRAGRLDKRQRSNAWFKAIDAVGATVSIWPIETPDLPRWLGGRLRDAGIELCDDALAAFAERVEGNLLAAVQEIAKLKLQDLPSPVSLDALLGVLQDASHYDAFELIDATLAGDARRVERIVAGLRAQGVSEFAVLGALVSQLRRIASGARFFGPRERLVKAFTSRVGRNAIPHMLAECALIDRQGKGGLRGEAWPSLEALLLRLAGVRGVPLLRQHLPYRKVGG